MDRDERKRAREDRSIDRYEWKEWKNSYKESMGEWKKEYRKALKEWKDRYRDWRRKSKSSEFKVAAPPLPPLPPMPPIHSVSVSRANVVASRIGDEELQLIDRLIEAGLFSTRSEAVAYLVSEGIKARRDVFDKVSSALEEIREIRREAEDRVEKLKEEVGFAEAEGVEETEEQERTCPECGEDLSDMPSDISVCPYCGTKLEKE